MLGVSTLIAKERRYYMDRGSLRFSEDRLELTVKSGQLIKGHFSIEDDKARDMEGYVYSSSIRMRTMVDVFHGSRADIPYEFDASGMEPGTVLKGNISLVSNIGEYILPFVVTVSLSVIRSSIGEIKNLFHFTNLCKSDWNEAISVFSDPDFISIMKGQDAKFRNLYLGLCKGNKNYNLEEFLVGINKKQKIELSIDSDTVNLIDPQSDIVRELEISRNGWGYTLIAVKSEGDFIKLGRNKITSDDFNNGNNCRLEYTIVASELKKGINYGRITLRSLYDTLTCDITVSNNRFINDKSRVLKAKSTQFSLMRHYMDYATGRIDKTKWLQLATDLVEHRLRLGVDELQNNLYKTHLLLLEEKYNEAKWILDRKVVNIEESSNELYSYYLYLMALYNVDDYYKREATDRIKSIYERDPDNWRVAWVLMHISDELIKYPSRMYAFGIRQLERGCHSPIFYVELIRLLNKIPSALVHYDDEEIRLCYFAARNRLIDDELRGQIIYHALRKREFNKVVLRTLLYMNESKETPELTEAICAELIHGNVIDAEAHKFYSKAISNNISLTRLYENFLLSMDRQKDEVIPREVLIYFSYRSNLPPKITAFLYAYVVKKREEIPDIYDMYETAIDTFTVKQLYAKKMSRDLSVLYHEIILNKLSTVDNMRQLSALFLINGIRVTGRNIVNIVVSDERLSEELVYPVVNGEAYVPITGSDVTVLAEDSMGHRFYQTIEMSTERFFLPRKKLPALEKYIEDSVLFDLYACDCGMEYIRVNERNASRFLYLESNENVSDKFRAAIRIPLIFYYQDKDDVLKADVILGRLDRKDVPYKDRDEYLRFLCIRGYVDRALEDCLFFGPENIEPKILLRIASSCIEKNGKVESEGMSAVILSAFDRGKYNETTLDYLASFYRGPAKNLRNIWRCASGFYIDTVSICEKIIAQTLRTGAFIGEEVQILKEYVEGGGSTELELRYLSYFAHEHFVNDRLADDYFFREMARIYENEGKLPLCCMLSFLKHYSLPENRGLIDETIRPHIIKYIHILYKGHGIVMPFMKEYKSISKEAMEISGYTMLEYTADEGAKVTINYMMSEDGDGRGYTREEMVPVYGGVYVKSFLLFFGETLQYYIVENKDGEESLTESGTLSRNDVDNEENVDKYSMINDIAIATTLKDYDTALELLEEYKYKEYITNHLFKVR